MEEGPSRKLAVLLHADVAGSTSLVRINETLAHQRIQDTFRRFSATIATHGGVTQVHGLEATDQSNARHAHEKGPRPGTFQSEGRDSVEV